MKKYEEKKLKKKKTFLFFSLSLSSSWEFSYFDRLISYFYHKHFIRVEYSIRTISNGWGATSKESVIKSNEVFLSFTFRFVSFLYGRVFYFIFFFIKLITKIECIVSDDTIYVIQYNFFYFIFQIMHLKKCSSAARRRK